jgi:neuropeptide Y receptor
MRTAHNYFVVALALSDLFLCLFSMPITLWELLFEQWPFGANTTWLCRCFASGKVLPLFMSSMAIVAVGWDRYRCIIQSER